MSESEQLLTVVFDETGLHALNCYYTSGGEPGVDYPTLITGDQMTW